MTRLTTTTVATILALLWAMASLAADTSGCGKKYSSTGISQTYNITSAGMDREYLLHLPDNYNANSQYPVIMAFPGSSEPAFAMEIDTGLSMQTVTGDKIIIYAQGVNSSWAGASYSNTTTSQDFGYINNVLTDIRSKFCINSNKIYATGFSLGAGLIDLIACDNSLSSQFAAFAPASGAYYQEANKSYTCKPSRSPQPILFIHGGADSELPYDGGYGEGGFLLSVAAVVDRWVTRNKCTNITEEQQSDNDVQHYSWDCAGYANLTQHWKVDDMDHQWASLMQDLTSEAVGGNVSKIEASVIINAFFDLWELDQEVATTSAGIPTTSISGVLLSTTQGTTTAPAVLATLTGPSGGNSISSTVAASGNSVSSSTAPAAIGTTGANAATGNTAGMQSSFFGVVAAVLAGLL